MDAKLSFLHHGIDIENNKLYLIGAVDESLYRICAIGLPLLVRYNLDAPITIILNTGGGEVEQALAIIEMIKYCPVPVRIHAVGACMSAGAIILQAGTTRSASKDCSIMVHFGEETNSSGSEAKHNAKLTKRMKDILRERTGRSIKMINKWLVADTYFTADEAKKVNLIDEVIS